MAVPLRIFLIDDHPGSLLVLRHVLRSQGHVCEGVQSVESALALIPAFQPQVILYEWHLRGGRGLGLPRRLRAQSAARRIAIVALSTANEPDGFVESEGIDGYINKPFCPSQLDALLATVGTRLSLAGGSA